MKKKSLAYILEGKIFQIPDYQRGYAWEEKQLKDFVQDIDSIIDDKIISHYMGTIVIYQPMTNPTEKYGTKKLEIVDVVDGQQRLASCSLYLSIIIKKLIKSGCEEFITEIPYYIFTGRNSKLILNNNTTDFYLDLISKGIDNTVANSIHQKRIYVTYIFFKNHIEKQLKIRANNGEEYLRGLFDAIIGKLNFCIYTIELESAIEKTFELINSRGKEFSFMND